ncbi:D-3-phosphoglycerate dehydrogenase [Verticillium dahliae VDG2]|nr:D-3-phosphoglycerate dehydrogenase [Verticillium dahliae VDG2]
MRRPLQPRRVRPPLLVVRVSRSSALAFELVPRSWSHAARQVWDVITIQSPVFAFQGAEDLAVAAISTSPFFAVLPPEVRIEVLVIAFCGLRLAHGAAGAKAEASDSDAQVEKSLFVRLDQFASERLRLERFTVAIPESLLVPPENGMDVWHALVWRSLKSEGRDEPIDEAEHKNKHTFTRKVQMNQTDENGPVISSNGNVTMPNPPAAYDKGKPVPDRGYCIVEGLVNWLARDTASVNSGL